MDADEFNPLSPDNSDSIIDNSVIDKNMSACRLVNIHINHIYKNIEIPYKYFAENNWDIIKLIYEKRIIPYNPDLMSDETKEIYDSVLTNYNTIIFDIFSYEGILNSYLGSWTDTQYDYRWKYNGKNSFLRRILRSEQYIRIDPTYILEYFNNCIKSSTSTEISKSKTLNYLDNIIDRTEKIIKEFEKNISDLMENFMVKEFNDNPDDDMIILTKLFDCIINLIRDMLTIHVYKFNDVIDSTVGEYIPISTLQNISVVKGFIIV